VIFVSILEHLRIAIVNLLALVEAVLSDLVGLQLAGLDAFVVLFTEFEIDLHALLSLRGVDGLYVCAVEDVPFYHN